MAQRRRISMIDLKMQSVLVRGTFRGFDRFRSVKLGLIDIEWVYNSMPPCYGQIYPEVEIDTRFT